MDAKILVGGVGGVVGFGLLMVTGVLILGGGSNEADLQQASGVGNQQIDLNTGVSAYDISPNDVGPAVVVDAEPKELQATRRNRGRENEGGDPLARIEDRMMQFDTDGDGILSSLERDAMVESMRQRMIDRFDADGDGMVSIQEQFAARRDSMLNSRRGQRMRDEFDKDGDGELNEQELAAMNAELDRRDADRMEEVVKQYDMDGDGEMSVEETLAMQDQQVAQRRSRMDQFTMRFDEDGDGDLNADERARAINTVIEQREIDRFLRRYDTNKDGQMDTGDSERFVEAYGKKEPYGDVNRDGIFNMDDVVMFRDMTEQINSKED